MVAVNRNWLFSKIITTIPKVLIAAYVGIILIKILFNLPNNLLEKNDFLDFWVASSLTIGGEVAIPLAWIGWEGYQKGWLPGEKIFLLIGWLTPFISRVLAEAKVVQLTPFILMGLLYLNLRSLRLSRLGPAPLESPGPSDEAS
jgi:hypothetical protein